MNYLVITWPRVLRFRKFQLGRKPNTYEMDPVWVIIAAPFGSYSKAQMEITFLYNDSTLEYIQFFPVSTSLEYAGMKHVKRDKAILINETCKKR